MLPAQQIGTIASDPYGVISVSPAPTDRLCKYLQPAAISVNSRDTLAERSPPTPLPQRQLIGLNPAVNETYFMMLIYGTD